MNKLLDDLKITLTDIPTPEERDFMHQQIRAYNNQESEYHRNIRPSGPKPLAVFIRNSQNKILGGLVGDTYWGWLNIDDFWIDKSLWGKGYGKKLLEMAETEAKSRGCLSAFLSTYSFQARGFYEKFGYRIIGQMDDYPPGQSYYWMRKDF